MDYPTGGVEVRCAVPFGCAELSEYAVADLYRQTLLAAKRFGKTFECLASGKPSIDRYINGFAIDF